jgi:hypothetical protein
MERIEENQESAMRLWRDTGNGESWFALRLSDGAVYMISYSKMEENGLMKTVLSKWEIKRIGISLETWVAQCE